MTFMKNDRHRRIGAIIAALTPLGLASCSSSIIGEFDSRVCFYDSQALADLAPAVETDYVALRSYSPMVSGAPSTTAEWGSLCANASDVAACEAALAAVPADAALISIPGQVAQNYDVVFTRGDETGRISDVDALLALLGTIDTPNEALLLAQASGHQLPCGEDNLRVAGDGYVLLGSRGNTCGGDVSHYEITVTADGAVSEGPSEVVEEGDPNCAIGRRPDALASHGNKACTVGAFFANAAHLEAASVYAFTQLAAELVAHGAPRQLVRAAWRARADEIRHAHSTAALARRFGARPIRPRVPPHRVRNLFDVARDNATEGCVRETFGALAASVQARAARSRAVRRAMRPIAADETRHATLSWAVDAWARSQLAPVQRRALDRARRQSVARLRDESAQGWSAEITNAAGMPTAEASARMVEELDAVLWQA